MTIMTKELQSNCLEPDIFSILGSILATIISSKSSKYLEQSLRVIAEHDYYWAMKRWNELEVIS